MSDTITIGESTLAGEGVPEQSKSRVDQTLAADPWPGRPRILFIGNGDSSHEHSWIDLLDGARFNVRLFSRWGSPPESWGIPTYLSNYKAADPSSPTRARLYSRVRGIRYMQGLYERRALGGSHKLSERWLARIIEDWKPDVIHTLGLAAAAEFYYGARTKYGLEKIGTWVLQTRGGSDFELDRFDPKRVEAMTQVLRSCDRLICDNPRNFEYALEMGMRPDQFSSLGPVPGTGGIDIEDLERRSQTPTSERRMILWPKAYESMWSRSLPVLEALREIWEDLQPCEIKMFGACFHTSSWYRTLPRSMQRQCHLATRVPRHELLDLMTKARVMLAPSLVDGVPNTMFEAMASGAVPIVSPLQTITPVVEEGENVLFARNLYPNEIADALVKAMSDDAMVDDIARRNRRRVRELADRSAIRPRVIEFYERLVHVSSI